MVLLTACQVRVSTLTAVSVHRSSAAWAVDAMIAAVKPRVCMFKLISLIIIIDQAVSFSLNTFR